MKALNYEINLAELSPQLQVLVQLELRQNALEKQQYAAPIQMSMNFDPTPLAQQSSAKLPDSFVSLNDWRKDTNKIICRIEKNSRDYAGLHKKIYRELESRYGCNLQIRLENLRKNMLYQGASASEVKKKNYLDVIEKDKRLFQGYLSIIRELARANQISFEKQYRTEG